MKTTGARSIWGRGLALSLLAATFLACPSAAITGSEVIENVQKNFGKHKTFSAVFEKQFYWAVLDKSSSRQGKFYTRKPGMFRVEIEDGDLVVADGKAIWAYTSRNEQVIVSPYKGELKTPWEVLVDYAEGFEPVAVDEAKLGKKECYMITLKPRTNSAYFEQMKIWINRKNWQVLKVEQREANENITTYILKDQKVNKKVDETLFQFEPPEGVEIIDQRTNDSTSSDS